MNRITKHHELLKKKTKIYNDNNNAIQKYTEAIIINDEDTLFYSH